jgi:hypothetical protein
MPARIAFVAPFGLGQKTTVWARTLPLARYLASQGQAVTLVIPPWDTPADAGKRMTDGGVEVVQVALGGGLPAVISRMLAVVNGWQPDLVHIVKPRAHAGIIQWLLWQRRKVKGSPAARRHTPAILLDVDDWEQAWAPINRYRWPVARFLAWQEEWGIRHADGITAASRWLVERVRQYTPQTPVLYLPNGIRNAGYGMRDTGIRDQAGQAVTRILFFTRFVEVEPAWLAQCWRAIAAALPTAHLVLAGSPVQPGLDAPFRQALAGEAAERVQWLGTRRSMPRWLVPSSPRRRCRSTRPNVACGWRPRCCTACRWWPAQWANRRPMALRARRPWFPPRPPRPNLPPPWSI